jgi:hypothetical protein
MQKQTLTYLGIGGIIVVLLVLVLSAKGVLPLQGQVNRGQQCTDKTIRSSHLLYPKGGENKPVTRKNIAALFNRMKKECTAAVLNQYCGLGCKAVQVCKMVAVYDEKGTQKREVLEELDAFVGKLTRADITNLQVFCECDLGCNGQKKKDLKPEDPLDFCDGTIMCWGDGSCAAAAKDGEDCTCEGGDWQNGKFGACTPKSSPVGGTNTSPGGGATMPPGGIIIKPTAPPVGQQTSPPPGSERPSGGAVDVPL